MLHLPKTATSVVTPLRRAAVKAGQLTSTTSMEVQLTASTEGLGRITLCRERQLNALGAEHVEQMRQQLLDWARPASGIKAVLLDSSTARAFCSGGDVKAARQAVLDQPYQDHPPAGHHMHRVFQAEYGTLLHTSHYPVPIVACCQGIWMGLGFGLAGFGRYRVVSDGTVFAMPECHIGLWPDVGFAFKAAHMPGHLGLLLGLSGVRLSSAADLLYCGIATHYIPTQQLQAFKDVLSLQPAAVEALLEQYDWSAGLGPGPLQRLQPLLDKHLQQLLDRCRSSSGGCAVDELASLHDLQQQLKMELPGVHDRDHEAAHLLQNVINGLAYGAPRSQVITLRHFSNVRQAVLAAAAGSEVPQAGSSGLDLSTLDGVMQMEYRMAVRQVAHEDFIEGVRAALVDKDRHPAWLQQQISPELQSVQKQQQQQQKKKQAQAQPQQGEEHVQQLLGTRFAVQHLFEPLQGSDLGDHHMLHQRTWV